RGGTLRVLSPFTATSPPKVPPEKCGTSPFSVRRMVDFPDPDRPMSSASSPRRIRHSIDSRVGSALSGHEYERSLMLIITAVMTASLHTERAQDREAGSARAISENRWLVLRGLGMD